MTSDLPAWIPADPGTIPTLPGGEGRDGHVIALLSTEGALSAGWAGSLAVELVSAWSAGGRRIVAADAGLSTPLLHDALAIPNHEGLVDALRWGVSVQRVIQRPEGRGFLALTVGTAVADADAVMGLPRWPALCAGFREAGVTLVVLVPSWEEGLGAVLGEADGIVVLAEADEDPASVLGGVQAPVLAVLGRAAGAPPTDEAPGAGAPAAGDDTAPAADVAPEASGWDLPELDDLDVEEPSPGEEDAAEVEDEGDVDIFQEFMLDGAEGTEPAAEEPDVTADEPLGIGDTLEVEDALEPAHAPYPEAAPGPEDAPAVEDVFDPLDMDLEAAPGTEEDADALDLAVVDAGDHGGTGPADTAATRDDGEPADEVIVHPLDPSPAGGAVQEAEEDDFVLPDPIPVPPSLEEIVEESEAPLRKGRAGTLLILLLLVLAAVAAAAWFGYVEIPGIAPRQGTASMSAAEPGVAAAVPATVTSPLQSYSLALGAYQDAIVAAQRVTDLGVQAPGVLFQSVPVEVDGTLYHRVLAGPATDSAAVAVLSARIAESASLDPSSWVARWTPKAFVLGEMPDREAADRRVGVLGGLGISAYVLAVDYSDGSTRYRVFSGAFADDAEASYLSGLLDERGLSSATLSDRTGRLPE